jgi:hypothetical protein
MGGCGRRQTSREGDGGDDGEYLSHEICSFPRVPQYANGQMRK